MSEEEKQEIIPDYVIEPIKIAVHKDAKLVEGNWVYVCLMKLVDGTQVVVPLPHFLAKDFLDKLSTVISDTKRRKKD